jgi:hypothetical protein
MRRFRCFPAILLAAAIIAACSPLARAERAPLR